MASAVGTVREDTQDMLLHVNDILHRALTAAKIPSRLEPSGLSSTDGSRPDGMTIVPWRSGRPLVWDATCPDTLAVSYRSRATCGAGLVAALAEEKKSDKFSHLSSQYHFVPVAIETFGAMGPAAASLIKELGSRGSYETGEEKFGLYLYQRLSISTGNMCSICKNCAFYDKSMKLCRQLEWTFINIIGYRDISNVT